MGWRETQVRCLVEKRWSRSIDGIDLDHHRHHHSAITSFSSDVVSVALASWMRDELVSFRKRCIAYIWRILLQFCLPHFPSFSVLFTLLLQTSFGLEEKEEIHRLAKGKFVEPTSLAMASKAFSSENELLCWSWALPDPVIAAGSRYRLVVEELITLPVDAFYGRERSLWSRGERRWNEDERT